MIDYQYIIALSMISGVGPTTSKTLISAFGSAEDVFKASLADIRSVVSIGPSVADAIVNNGKSALDRAKRELDLMSRYSIHPVSIYDAEYSKRLAVLENSPIVLYLKGKTDMNALKILSIVGTRRPTDYGRSLCGEIVAELASRHSNLLIVSGLAYGIDIAAHRAALKAGVPTAGVLAHGLDILYPSQHADSARQMIENNGCIISEYKIGTQPEAPNFVARNRIVAAMADATLVVESGAKGGSLITALDAFRLGRDVLAVPGSPDSEMSRGCNALIRDEKAHLVTCAEDIEKRLSWTSATASPAAVQGSLFDNIEVSDNEQQIYDLLMVNKTMSASELSQASGQAISQINTLLLQMEFAGKVSSLPGNIYKLVK